MARKLLGKNYQADLWPERNITEDQPMQAAALKLNDEGKKIFREFQHEKLVRQWTLAKQAAKTSTSLLITGEPSVGKRTMAKEIHLLSMRSGEFVVIDAEKCSDKLDVFFNSLTNSQISTCVIENVEHLPSDKQIELNTLIEKQGSNRNPIRFIATSTADFSREVYAGNFYRELYYRLNVIRIDIPSLRNCKRDIPGLCQFFLDNHSLASGYENMNFLPEAMEMLVHHNWPGNIHELQNVVHRAIVLSTSYEIGADCVEIEVYERKSDQWIQTLPIGLTMKDVETHFILQTLKHHDGNRTHCAKTLGISLRTLRNKINEFKSRGIQVVNPLRRIK